MQSPPPPPPPPKKHIKSTGSHYNQIILYDLEKKKNGKYKVFIKVDSIDWGSYEVKKSHRFTICVGPKLSYMPYAYEFKNGQSIPRQHLLLLCSRTTLLWTMTHLVLQRLSYLISQKIQFLQPCLHFNQRN
ncbi:hypothetical protein TVAG_130450 [Trichomonas vaginalis G3]|uniref:Uncharacterized protein n=1 Tax=Trichomonas vaginalis (strain ATCC PRA-98 / G3) TaxID=412133 RepID=A2G8Z5_TRIV3|nr:hypothetical protein TVAGG3_0665350 [Trichomonas vaginalis G3]EAX86375.1 hypothetical protein TVAG_130450 [Trichomonas vaginalis G3]KAI5506794.1 hypothetical protein TVAGG3_0665350 [Trichomonas vaginalis G3]|eukprot:XP_001299305.1 hypothetical protein [Trichomonas vaginalis G3]